MLRKGERHMKIDWKIIALIVIWIVCGALVALGHSAVLLFAALFATFMLA